MTVGKAGLAGSCRDRQRPVPTEPIAYKYVYQDESKLSKRRLRHHQLGVYVLVDILTACRACFLGLKKGFDCASCWPVLCGTGASIYVQSRGWEHPEVGASGTQGTGSVFWAP